MGAPAQPHLHPAVAAGSSSLQGLLWGNTTDAQSRNCFCVALLGPCADVHCRTGTHPWLQAVRLGWSGFGAGLSVGKALIEEQAALLNGLLSYSSSLLGSPCEWRCGQQRGSCAACRSSSSSSAVQVCIAAFAAATLTPLLPARS